MSCIIAGAVSKCREIFSESMLEQHTVLTLLKPLAFSCGSLIRNN